MDEMIISKYNAMTNAFLQQSENLLKEIEHSYNHAVDSGLKQYITNQDGYVAGYNEIVKQALTVNGEMERNLDLNTNQLRENLKTTYEQLMQNYTQAYEHSMAQFKTQCDDILKMFPTLDAKSYHETVPHLDDIYKKNKHYCESEYKVAYGQIEKKHKDLAEEIKIPEVPPPKVTPFKVPEEAGAAPAKKSR